MFYSPLELLVIQDMEENGYDSSSIEDIEAYWEGKLNGN